MKKKLKYILGSICLLCFCLQGCVPDFPDKNKHKIPFNIPKIFKSFRSHNTASIGPTLQSSAFNTADESWNNFFIDRELRHLIQIALKSNQGLKILQQEIEMANNEVLSRKGAYLPKIGGGFTYNVERYGEYTSLGASDRTTQYEPGKFVPTILQNQDLGFFAFWEIDIWRKLRNARLSAYYRYLASIEVKKYMVTHLVSEIANTYYELLALDNQLIIIRNFIKILETAQKVAALQKTAARATALPVKRFEAEVLKNRSRLYAINQKIIVHENKLNVLAGRFPKTIKRRTLNLMSLLPRRFSTGVPLNLLDNRPDVKQAVYELTANKIDVKVARARFFPTLIMDPNIGYQAFASKFLFLTPESIFLNTATNLALPIINRRNITAEYFTANNKQLKAMYNYQHTVLNAYQEVSNQIASIGNLKHIYLVRSKQVRALKESVDISNVLFQAARVSYLESLMTKRDLLEAEIQLVEIKKDQLKSYVSLYKALGGGWRGSKV